MQYSISAPHISDKTQWQALYYGYAEFYQVPMDQQILDTLWGWINDPNEEIYCLVAKDPQGNCLGLMHYRAMPSPLRGSKVGFLDDLFISADSRGNGLVEQMFAALEQQAKHHQWPIVRWITAQDNQRARAVYEKVSTKTQWLTYQLNC